jgi:hypothetical protein
MNLLAPGFNPGIGKMVVFINHFNGLRNLKPLKRSSTGDYILNPQLKQWATKLGY